MKLAYGDNLRRIILYTKNKKHFTKPTFCVIMIKEIGFVCFAIDFLNNRKSFTRISMDILICQENFNG